MAHRLCEDCGASMQPFVRRTRRDDGSLVCKACLPEERGGRRGGGRPEATPRGYRSPQHWESAKKSWEPRRPERDLPDRFEPLFEGRRKRAATLPPQGGSELDRAAWEVKSLVNDSHYSLEMAVSAALRHYDVTEEELREALGDFEPRRLGRRKHAHDSGDGETLYHCPFCGAGQLVGNADGTAQCQFCNTTFTVQVQPNQPEMPQTVDGEPYPMPDMPGEPQGGESGLPPPPVEEETPVTPKEEEQQPPQFATSSGHRLSEDDYIAHLALRHARNREATLRAIRTQRGR